MEIYELMKLPEGVGEQLDEHALQKINCFLTSCYDAYKQKNEDRFIIRRVDWNLLNTSHLREEFGSNCRLMGIVLERIEQEESRSQIDTKFREIGRFLEDEEFRLFCHRSLEELQKKAQCLLGEGPDLTPSRSSREIESGRESFEDMKNLYQETKTLQEKAEEYARAVDEHLKAVDQLHQETKKFQENAEKYAQAADEHLKVVDQLQKRTAQFKRDALNAQRAAESIIPNMLTALGVFIAIVVAVVGCYLSLIFNKHQNPDFPVLNLSVCLLMGHILLNVIFLLMYLISKLTNYTMACHCHIVSQSDCSICPMEVRQKCKLPNRIWLRYPYVILLNGLFPVGYLSLALWSLLRYYLGSEIDRLLFDSPHLVLLLATALTTLFAYVLWRSYCLMCPSDELHGVAVNHTKSQNSSKETEAPEREDIESSGHGVP